MANYAQMRYRPGPEDTESSPPLTPIVFLDPKGELPYVQSNYPELEVIYLRRQDPVIVAVKFSEGEEESALALVNEVNAKI